MFETTKCGEELRVKLQDPRDFTGLYEIVRKLGQYVHEVDIVSTISLTQHEALITGTCTAELDPQGVCPVRASCLRMILNQAGVRTLSACPHIS